MHVVETRLDEHVGYGENDVGAKQWIAHLLSEDLFADVSDGLLQAFAYGLQRAACALNDGIDVLIPIDGQEIEERARLTIVAACHVSLGVRRRFECTVVVLVLALLDRRLFAVLQALLEDLEKVVNGLFAEERLLRDRADRVLTRFVGELGEFIESNRILLWFAQLCFGNGLERVFDAAMENVGAIVDQHA